MQLQCWRFCFLILSIYAAMNINKENIDDLNAVVSIQISEEDYKDKVAEVLLDYRKKAKVDGFRPGKAPSGLVKKMYGTAVLVDEVNKLLSEKLTKYLYENDFRVLGEPLPNEDSPAIDWENQKDFEFAFDIGVAPEIDLALSKRDKIKWYAIDIDETFINDQAENYAKKFGNFEPADLSVADDMLKGDLTELDENGKQKEGGVVALDALVALNSIADEEAKTQFVGLKVGDEVKLDMLKIFPNETERSTLLKITKEQLEDISNSFLYTIGEVSRFTPASFDQELFDKAYGPDKIKSEEEFRQRIKEDLQSQMERESFYKFHIDAKEKLVKKTKISLPDEFLKRWMLATSKDENTTKESLDKEYPRFSEDLKWQLIRDFIAKGQDFKIEEDEIKAEAVNVARAQFQQYGIFDAPEAQLIQFSQNILTKEDEQRKIKERILEDKVISFVREAVKLDEQTVSLDEFKELFK